MQTSVWVGSEINIPGRYDQLEFGNFESQFDIYRHGIKVKVVQLLWCRHEVAGLFGPNQGRYFVGQVGHKERKPREFEVKSDYDAVESKLFKGKSEDVRR